MNRSKVYLIAGTALLLGVGYWVYVPTVPEPPKTSRGAAPSPIPVPLAGEVVKAPISPSKSVVSAPVGSATPTAPVAPAIPTVPATTPAKDAGKPGAKPVSLAPMPATAAGDTDSPPPAAPAAPATREAAAILLDGLQFTLRDYRTVLGGNPVGTNAEITASLLGQNLKQLKLTLPEGLRVNGEGELCDVWGTPFFFHQVSATKMEIRSAGPDRTMWTGDDLQ